MNGLSLSLTHFPPQPGQLVHFVSEQIKKISFPHCLLVLWGNQHLAEKLSPKIALHLK